VRPSLEQGCRKQTPSASILFSAKHFIKFRVVLVETNEVVRSNSDVMFTRQTCGHRLSRVAGNKHRALAFYFSVRIWYIFLISRCRGKSDLGVCMTTVLAKRMRTHSAYFRFKTCLAAEFVGSRHCAAEFSLQVPKSCTH